MGRKERSGFDSLYEVPKRKLWAAEEEEEEEVEERRSQNLFFFSFRPRKVGGTVVRPFNISPSDQEMVRFLRFSASLQDVNHRTENQYSFLYSSLVLFQSLFQ